MSAEERILAVVAELNAILTELGTDDSPANVLFPVGDDWALLYAVGERAQQIKDDAKAILGVEVDDDNNSV